jgi:hypothetical protein
MYNGAKLWHTQTAHSFSLIVFNFIVVSATFNLTFCCSIHTSPTHHTPTFSSLHICVIQQHGTFPPATCASLMIDPFMCCDQINGHVGQHLPAWDIGDVAIQSCMLPTLIHTYRNSPPKGHSQGANERLMGQKQELKDKKPESSVEHEIKSSTSEAGQLPADVNYSSCLHVVLMLSMHACLRFRSHQAILCCWPIMLSPGITHQAAAPCRKN